MTKTAKGYTQLSVCNSTGNTHADIKGNNEARAKSKQTAAKRNAIATLRTKGKGEQSTISTPAQAPSVIKSNICHCFIFHTRLSTIHIPMVRAAISGKIISFSCSNSATPIINSIMTREKRYLFRCIVSLNNETAFVSVAFISCRFISLTINSYQMPKVVIISVTSPNTCHKDSDTPL